MHVSTRCSPLLVALALGVVGAACDTKGPAPTTGPSGKPISEPPTEGTPTGATRLRTVYVPAYSHLPRGAKMDQRAPLSILLSVRNVDSTAAVTLTHVDYFDTSGRRVRRYLEAPRTLRPLETAEFTVATRDETGGSGANFLVYWEGLSDAHPLLVEAVMLANLGDGYVAFTSRGVELERRPNPAMFKAGTPPPSLSTRPGDKKTADGP